LIKGSGGIFDVVVDGDLIFSKKQVRRFPENSEIVAALNERNG
jgi:selT/selW/selH-like putative selenoprotein